MSDTPIDLDVRASGRGTTVERVVRHLRNGIMANRYAPGQRLIEADLTRDLGVSRGPLREAFHRLSAEGLIETVPNRGAIVRRLSLIETIELFQIRTELEALAARLAARTVEDPRIRETFEATIRPIWSDTPRLSTAAYLEENRAFHTAVVVAGGNRQLIALHTQLQLPLIMFQVSGGLTAELLSRSVSEHRAIAEAILSGDASGADAATRRHLGRAAVWTREMPPSTFRTEP